MNDFVDLKRLHDSVAIEFPNSILYCIIDHAGMPGLHSILVQAGVPWTSLFQGSKEEGAHSVAPTLISVSDLVIRDVTLRNRIAEQGTFSSTIIFLASPLPLPNLARRLAARMDVLISEAMHVMFRYFDPRVFEAMLEIFSTSRVGEFLAIANCWWFMDRRGTLVRTEAVFSGIDKLAVPIVISLREESAFIDASEPDQVAQILDATLTNKFNEISYSRRYQFIQQHSMAAQKIGLVSTHDLSLYCGLAILYGENFALDDKWASILAKVELDNLSLSDAIAEVEDND